MSAMTMLLGHAARCDNNNLTPTWQRVGTNLYGALHCLPTMVSGGTQGAQSRPAHAWVASRYSDACDRVVSRSTCASAASMTAFCPRRDRAAQAPVFVTRWMSAVIVRNQVVVIVSRRTNCMAAAAVVNCRIWPR